VRPPIDGLDLAGVHVLHTMGDTFALHQALAAGARSAIIVGGGYIGLEMAEAFTGRGLSVTLMEQAPAVMPTVDLDLGRLLGEELRHHDVQVVSDVTVKAIHHDSGGLTVVGKPDFTAAGHLVLVVVGGPPRHRPGRGRRCPDRRPWRAAGRPAHAHQPARRPGRRRLRGDLAPPPRPARLRAPRHHRPQAGPHRRRDRCGRRREFAGSLGTQVVKVFDLAVARTGLRDQEAAAAGLDPLTVGSVQFDHKAYYPGAHQLDIRITGDRQTGRLLGAQLVGDHRAEVAERIDIPAGALFHAMAVDGLSDLDLSYTPPFGSPWDAMQLAGQDWIRQARSLPA
jgi:NADPH-dependent 2,4-dienoyl-CoA reductase/sulfur reductase-like enzyme